ncbi:unnamed protein product [Blepharisma stoltei]|uniref:Uncharacterized protein n=1 Tax=Blepharisma stoltei TaxID=1481888 RepID=A0AAU9JRE7_9CILI|nr:unnamed protein product [Blepharisma stoltei]
MTHTSPPHVKLLPLLRQYHAQQSMMDLSALMNTAVQTETAPAIVAMSQIINALELLKEKPAHQVRNVKKTFIAVVVQLEPVQLSRNQEIHAPIAMNARLDMAAF